MTLPHTRQEIKQHSLFRSAKVADKNETKKQHSLSDEPPSVEGSPTSQSRREWFRSVGAGLQVAALTHLVSRDALASDPNSKRHEVPTNLRPRQPHFEPAAQSVIHLFMNGGPSQMDLFDPKDELTKRHGQQYFDAIAGEVENPGAAGSLMRSPFQFARHGNCGMWMSELLPHLATCADDIAVLRSMYTTNLTHEPALYLIQSGRMLTGLPTLGAWVTYGLGSENQNLPAYMVLDDPRGLPINRSQNWQSGFLPPIFQGTRIRSTGSPILNLNREFEEPDAITEIERDLIARLDRIHKRERNHIPDLAARISNYELAARMQLEATDALDISQETQATQDSYGIGEGKTTDSYGRRCLYARRLVERGVRFVQLFIDAQIWDNHTQIVSGLRGACSRTDQPIAALIKDLKARGFLDSTLIVWGGEFGRLPIAQLPGDKDVRKAGRDHNKNAMVSWMAGGGIKGAVVHGTTDEIGLKAADDPVSVPDFHATILNQLGLNHKELFIERNGLEERLTSVFPARVVREIVEKS
jgi:hypothetical protein